MTAPTLCAPKHVTKVTQHLAGSLSDRLLLSKTSDGYQQKVQCLIMHFPPSGNGECGLAFGSQSASQAVPELVGDILVQN